MQGLPSLACDAQHLPQGGNRMGRITGWSTSLVAAALLAGCAHHKGKAPEIKEDWLARVPPGEMQPVERARSDLRQAKDNQNRAEVGLQDAKNRLDVAKAEQDAAKSRVDAAENQVKAARNTGDAQRVQRAQTELSQAEAGRAAADAKVDWADANREAAQARVDYAKAAVKTQEAQVKQAEYQVLARTNDTRVKDMHPESFQAEVNAREADEAKAQGTVREKEQKVASAYQRWNQARTRFEQGQGGPTG